MVQLCAIPMLIACAITEEWVLLKNLTYDPMQEAIDLRSLENPTQSPISASEISYLRTITSSCWGAADQSPPWTTYFGTIFSSDNTAWYSTSGTVSALHIRHWQLKWWNTGGEQKWRKTSDNSTYERTRVDRTNPWVATWEVPMTGGGGGIG